MPIMRVSTSVALRKRRIAGSFKAALVAPGATEAILPPDLILRRRYQSGRRCNRKPRRFLERRGPLLFHSVLTRSTQPQNFTVPGFTPAQTSALLIQPLSTITLRLSLVTGSGGHLLAGAERDSRLARDLAEVARVLPDRNGLGAERDAVDRRVVAVLA